MTIGESIQERMITDLQSMEAMLGNQTFVWRGETFVCVPSSDDNEEDFGVGGNKTNRIKTLTVRLGLFTPNVYPSQNDFVTMNNITWRIKTVTYNPNRVFVRLHLIDTNKGI